MKPLVSILVTSYNREKYIADCLESILNSTFQDFEIIIVDDASTDKTVEICKSYESRDKRVKLFINAFNLGQFKNRNKAASLANGTYLKYFDSDDILREKGLESMITSMNQFPVSQVGSECVSSKYHTLPKLFTRREIYLSHFFEGNTMLYVGPSGTIFTKDIFDRVGGFDENIGILADTHLMLRMASLSSVVGYVPNQFTWRRHDEQVTVGQDQYFEMLLERNYINKIVLNDKDCPLTKEETKIVFQNMKNIFIRKLPKHFLKLKSPSQLFSLMKSYNIRYVDLIHSFSKNKRLTV